MGDPGSNLHSAMKAFLFSLFISFISCFSVLIKVSDTVKTKQEHVVQIIKFKFKYTYNTISTCT